MATSKQPKQPPFPHPPLEVGVPQYPTPNVPDFYTKSGHIILVEKVSVEKGNYKPLPLDGTAVYQGRDANKWPSNLYLVAERPTEDGEYAYRYWANDRTLASQNPWNYGVDYSQNATGYPIYSRTYIVPRSQYAVVSNGSADPVFGGTAIVASQRMRKLPDDNPLRSRHVQVEVVYESIPGPLLGGQENSAGLLGVKTSSETTVPAGTSADTLNSTVVSSQVVPIDAVKSKKTTVVSTGPFSLSGGESKSGLLGNTSLTESIVAAGTSPDSLTTSVISSNVEPIDSAKSKKTTVVSTGPLSLFGAENKSGLLGATTLAESIVVSGSPADSLSNTVISSNVEPIDSAKSKKTTIISTGPTELDGFSNKPGLLGQSSVNEYIVGYGSSADALSFSSLSAVISSEVTPIDSAKSKKRTEISFGPFTLSGEKYEKGLLGEVKISEFIVEKGTSPDSLTQLIISSEVTPIDSAKSKKTTTTSSGPTQLIGFSNESGLLGQTSIFESIVDPTTAADSLTQAIVSSEVTPIDRAKSKKKNKVSGGPFTLSGSANEPGLLGSVNITEQIVDQTISADELTVSLVSSQITPIDSAKSKKTNKNSTGPFSFSGYKAGEFGPLSIGDSIVAAGDTLYASIVGASSGQIESEEVVQIDSAKSKHSILKYSSPVILAGLQYDSYLDSPIIIQKQLIATKSSGLTGIAGTSVSGGIVLEDEINPIDYIKSVRITKTLQSLPSARAEYYSGNYTNPNLVGNLNASTLTYNGAPVSIVKPTIYRGRTYHTNFAKYIEFIYSTSGNNLNVNPSGSPVGTAYALHPGFTAGSAFYPFSPQEIHLYYSGNIISFDYGMCLIDGSAGFLSESSIFCYDIVNSSGSMDKVYFNGQAGTSPSASQYLQYNNSYVPIGQKISYWKSNIWVRETEFVLIKVTGNPSS